MIFSRKSGVTLLALGLAILPACRPKAKMKPVTVRIFRDLRSPYANQLDRRLLEFQATNPHVSDGSPIVLDTFEEAQYKATLQNHIDRDMTAEIVVLNSPEDAASNPAVQAELANSVNICASVKACPTVVPAFVPSSLTGAPAEAGKQLLAFLQKEPG
jgi:hypothetical protein